MSEQKEQAKVMNWLKANNYWAIKTIECSRAGIMDIIACSPNGRFIGIEMKYGSGKASKLQSWNILEVAKRGGTAFVAWSLEEVQEKLKNE